MRIKNKYGKNPLVKEWKQHTNKHKEGKSFSDNVDLFTKWMKENVGHLKEWCKERKWYNWTQCNADE